MQINKELVLSGQIPASFNIPAAAIFDMPEKVLQFGTGVLLRGLPDFYIDKANKQGIFNGRIVVVKSTGGGTDEFAKQAGLYTHCIKGLADGKTVETYIVNASISKVLSALQHWNAILQYAESPDMEIIISNTTEIGIALKTDDDIHASPPASFPAKLLAFLYRRFQYFKGNAARGMVIVPTELIVDNGSKLKALVLELARLHTLEESFINWLDTANDFCNSLVDRIVPGALKEQAQLAFENKAGYKDALTIMSEPYSLWAIESSSERTKALLSFYTTDDTVIITPDISKYRTLKLRLLNATHTFTCALACLAGFNLVYESMQDEGSCTFISKLMTEEIAPCIVGSAITQAEAAAFATNVIDRFGNSFIEHKWLSISMNYTAKMKMRCLPLLLTYYEKTGKLPTRMCAGFAAYILFSKPVEVTGGVYYGMLQGKRYKIDDADAGLLYSLWSHATTETIVQQVLADESLWGIDLTAIPGLAAMVQESLLQFNSNQFKQAIMQL